MKRKVVSVKKEDNNYQRFEVIKRNRNKRYKYKEFFVEGVRNINEAIKNNWEFKCFLYSGEKALSNWAKNLINSVKVENVFELSQQLMEKLSDKDDTSEIIAIVTMKSDNINRIKFSPKPLVVVFDRPSNKGNLGTIIRSCDAMGCDGLIITGHAVDLYEPETIISSTGSFFKLPTIRLQKYSDIVDLVLNMKPKHPDVQIIGTDECGEVSINQCEFNKPTVLLIGNETDGLSRNYKQVCDEIAKIPIGGSASSLNVACATSILLYEISRQRNFK